MTKICECDNCDLPLENDGSELLHSVKCQVVDALQRERLKRNLTQRQLGSLCGMNQGDISKIENGRGNPSVRTLQRIASALNCRLVVRLESND